MDPTKQPWAEHCAPVRYSSGLCRAAQPL